MRVVAPARRQPRGKIPAAAEVIRGVSPCQHCGAEIALGLLRDTCPKGCDLTLRAAEPEPSTLLERWAVREPTGVGTRRIVDDPRPNSEPFWWAEGKGVQVNHPTRDGAIAAWRAAVKGGAR